MRIFLCLFLIFSTILLANQEKNLITEKYKKENIAVFKIQDNSSKYYSDIGTKLTSLIENALIRMNRFNVVDRKNLDKYLKEMELQLTGITEKQVIEVGKIYGYEKAITGQVTDKRVYYDYDSDDGIGIIYANVDMVIQIVDVETTKILYSSKVTGTSYYSILNYPSQSLREAAIIEACNDVVSKVENKMRSIFKIVLQIYDVNGNNVVLLAGKDHGINKTTRFRVYEKKEDIILPSGNILLNTGYNYKGTLRIKELGNEYTITKISHGKNIKVGDIARETYIGNFGFGIFVNYASYKMESIEKIYHNTIKTNEGKLKVSLKKNDYALGIHLKAMYNGEIFSPNISLGLLFGDFFKSSYGIDTRFNFDININLYKEVIRLVVTPYLGIGITFTTVGEIIGGNYYTSEYTYLNNGSKIKLIDIMFGVGALASIQYNIKDTIGINLGIGYRFYTKPLNLGIFSDVVDFTLPEKIMPVKLTGLEFLFGAYFIL